MTLNTFNGSWNWNFTNLQFWNTHNSSVDENYGKKKNSVQPNSMKNPQKPSVLKNPGFWRSFAIYKLVDIGNKFSTISSYRQHAGDPKFHHRGNIRCRFRWQWHVSEIRKFYHFSEWSPSSTFITCKNDVLVQESRVCSIFRQTD